MDCDVSELFTRQCAFTLSPPVPVSLSCYFHGLQWTTLRLLQTPIPKSKKPLPILCTSLSTVAALSPSRPSQCNQKPQSLHALQSPSHPSLGHPLALKSEAPSARARACTHTRTHARTHTRTHAHTHVRTHARTHARTYARMHARTHAHNTDCAFTHRAAQDSLR